MRERKFFMGPVALKAFGTEAELSRLDPGPFRGIRLPDEVFDHIFRTCDALWLHSGDPKDPHAELTSGKCSDGFVDTLRVLRHTNICRLMADQLLLRLRDAHYDGPISGDVAMRQICWVVGSDHAGATLSYAVAAQLGCMHDFTEKGPGKSQVWKRFQIGPDEPTLQVEELVTTTSTLNAVRSGILTGNVAEVQFVPAVLTLVHRSDQYEFDGSPILYVRHYDINTWDPGDCPLCAAGSERLRPKKRWAKLTGKT